MNKYIFSALLWAFSICFADDSIAGFWKTIDPDTKKPQSVVAVYEYKGKYYGRIIGTYNKSGQVDETMYAPKDRAPGIVGNPYYCGLDIIWNLRLRDNDRFRGKICNPQAGKVYDAELWVEDGNLIVRGMVWMFGANRTWLPFTDKEFSSHFKKPDVKKFVPVIPETN
ncbi:MAG: DUF2147 domain-containing protein [Verrucomicrobia bacterium]|nr:DUF2147 domain-containing protein [Verrucomicrobiota bacterium]